MVFPEKQLINESGHHFSNQGLLVMEKPACFKLVIVTC